MPVSVKCSSSTLAVTALTASLHADLFQFFTRSSPDFRSRSNSAIAHFSIVAINISSVVPICSALQYGDRHCMQPRMCYSPRRTAPVDALVRWSVPVVLRRRSRCENAGSADPEKSSARSLAVYFFPPYSAAHLIAAKQRRDRVRQTRCQIQTEDVRSGNASLMKIFSRRGAKAERVMSGKKNRAPRERSTLPSYFVA